MSSGGFPGLPSTLQVIDRIHTAAPETIGNFSAGVAARCTTIDHCLLCGPPSVKKMGELFRPIIRIERYCTWDVLHFVVRFWPGIDPQYGLFPILYLWQTDFTRRHGSIRKGRLFRMYCGAQTRQREGGKKYNQSLPARFHLLLHPDILVIGLRVLWRVICFYQ